MCACLGGGGVLRTASSRSPRSEADDTAATKASAACVNRGARHSKFSYQCHWAPTPSTGRHML